jgi:hypothetical protein
MVRRNSKKCCGAFCRLRRKPSITFLPFPWSGANPPSLFAAASPPPPSTTLPIRHQKLFLVSYRAGGGEGAPRGKTAKTEGGFAPEYQKRQKVMEGSLRRPHKPPLSRNPGPDAWACCQEKIKGPAMRATTLVPHFLAPPTSSTVLRLSAIPVGGHWHDL